MKPNTERDTIKIFESIGKERVPISGIEVQKKMRTDIPFLLRIIF